MLLLSNISLKPNSRLCNLGRNFKVSGDKLKFSNWMAFSKQRDFLFCNICGTLLTLESARHARCPLCRTRKRAKDICGKEISYTVSAEDIRRELRIPQLINPDGVYTEEVEQKQEGTLVSKVCGNCYHQGMLKITSAQLRSADEGETTFYECPECRIRTSD